MSKVLFILLISVAVLSCTSTDTPLVDLDLKIYPSSGDGEPEYVISIRNDTITTTNIEIKVQDGDSVIADTIHQSSRMLSEIQKNTLKQYVLKLGKHGSQLETERLILDAWIYLLLIDGREFARFDSLSLTEDTEVEELSTARRLIQYLIKISPLKMKLDSFA
jgi:hypothetical protein